PDHAPWDVTDGYTGPAFVDASGVTHLPDLDGKVDGKIQTSWTMDADAANSSFLITSVGLSSGDTAQTNFTDSQPSKVNNVSSTVANGTYTTGAVIPITVTFNQAVTVTGTPQLLLATGGAGTEVNFTSISSNGKTLIFNYTVAAGDNSANL